jgi:hypothetical protein
MYEARRYEMYRTRDWRSLAEQVQVEMDPEKLMNLVSELDSVLERNGYSFDCESYENRESHENRTKEWHSN